MPEFPLNNPRIVAAFDFDHTMIDRDSLLPFLFFTTGYAWSLYRLVKLLPQLLRFSVKDLSRQGVKEKILTEFFAGQSLADLQKKGQLYAAKQLDDYIKPQALRRLHWHQHQGHECMLVSASIDLYLTPWALRHGIKRVISSRLEVTPEGIITGQLQGLNCWGEEKRRRFLEELGPKDHYQLYVYGDSRGDLELLDLADFPFYRRFAS
ncbi:MAG: HAD-IB family hydrolase [Chlamydiales bacterium]